MSLIGTWVQFKLVRMPSAQRRLTEDEAGVDLLVLCFHGNLSYHMDCGVTTSELSYSTRFQDQFRGMLGLLDNKFKQYKEWHHHNIMLGWP